MSDQTPIAELMARDPLKLSDKDLDAIIVELRSQRHRFNTADDKKVGTPASKKSKAQVEKERIRSLFEGEGKSLDDLFSDL